MNKPPPNVGKPITLTTVTEDVFNELPIATSLKAPLEINHTTLLGLVVQAFEIEWSNIHTKHNFQQKQTRAVMTAYLQKYWIDINGVSCFLSNVNTNIMVFNQIHHSWQKMLEILLSLPHTTHWCGNINLLTNIIRMTGALHTCNSENRRKTVKRLMIKLLQDS